MNAIQAYRELGALPTSEPARLAQILSLSVLEEFDDVALARQVTNGLPVRSAAAIAAIYRQIGVALSVVPEPTLRRMTKAGKPLSRQHSERLYELSRVIDAVSRAFHGDADQVQAFLTRPHPLLQGETPAGLAGSSSAGADAVLNLIRRAEAGVAL